MKTRRTVQLDIDALRLTLQALRREADMAAAVVERQRLSGVSVRSQFHLQACALEVQAHRKVAFCEDMLAAAQK